jgi:uncharacterized protein
MGIRLACVVAAVAIAGTAVGSAEECARNQITIEGQAEVRVAPDRAHITFVVEQRGTAMAQAEAAATASTQVVLRALRDQGVVDADIDSSDYSVRPMYEWADGKKIGRRLGFSVRRTIHTTVRDLSKVAVLLARVAEDGTVSVGGVEPESENTRSRRDEARLMAVRAAREKAQAVVAELGQSLGRAVVIEVDGASGSACCGTAPANQPLAYNYTANAVALEGSAPNYSFGAITLSARVKVSFELK